MPIFGRKRRTDPFLQSIADGFVRKQLATYEFLKVEHPQMASAVDEIKDSQTLQDLDHALQHLCNTYDPVFHNIVSADEGSDRLGLLISFTGVWAAPATEKGEGIIRAATGKVLKPGVLGDRESEIAERDTPGYSIFHNPMPPRTQCRNLMLAIQSFL